MTKIYTSVPVPKAYNLVLIGPLPDYPQTTVDKVASVIELDFVYLFTWLIVCRQIFSFLSTSSSVSSAINF